MEAADRKGRAFRIKLIIVGDDERVAAPRLVLQTNRPNVARNFLAPDVWAGELDVLAMRRELHLEFLHALIHETVTNRRAAADQTIANRHEIKDLGHDARGET